MLRALENGDFSRREQLFSAAIKSLLFAEFLTVLFFGNYLVGWYLLVFIIFSTFIGSALASIFQYEWWYSDLSRHFRLLQHWHRNVFESPVVLLLLLVRYAVRPLSVLRGCSTSTTTSRRASIRRLHSLLMRHTRRVRAKQVCDFFPVVQLVEILPTSELRVTAPIRTEPARLASSCLYCFQTFPG